MFKAFPAWKGDSVPVDSRHFEVTEQRSKVPSALASLAGLPGRREAGSWRERSTHPTLRGTTEFVSTEEGRWLNQPNSGIQALICSGTLTCPN